MEKAIYAKVISALESVVGLKALLEADLMLNNMTRTVYHWFEGV